MPKHYVKIPGFIQEWFPGGAPDNWRELAFADATEGGRRLVAEDLPSNERGVRVAIHGDKFYFEVGRDRERDDTIFVTRIERSEHRLPHSTPRKIDAEYRLWPGGDPSPGDPVDGVFNATPLNERSPVVNGLAADPTPLLINRLASVPEELRTRCRPKSEDVAPQSPDVDKTLATARRVWARFRLARCYTVTPRQENLLLGRIARPRFDGEEWDQFLSIFGFGMLNAVATDETANVLGLIEAICDLAPMAFRARLWAILLIGLDSTGLRRELHIAAPAVDAIGQSALAPAWQAAVFPHLLEAARRAGDESLVGVLEGTHPQGNGLPRLAAWAGALDFGAETLAQRAPAVQEEPRARPEQTAATPTPLPTAPVAPGVERPAAVDDWVLRTSLPDSEWLPAFRREVGGAAKALSEAFENTALVPGLCEVSALTRQLQETVAVWVEDLPDPQVLNRDLEEARNAYERGRDAIGAAIDELIATLSPGELISVLDLIDRAELLRAIPAWMWTTERDSDPLTADALSHPAAWAILLGDSERRARIRSIVEFVDQIGHQEALGWIGAVPVTEIDRNLAQAFEQIRLFLEDVSPEVLSILTASTERAQIGDLQRQAGALRRLEEHLAPPVFQQLSTHLSTADANSRPDIVTGLSRAVDALLNLGFDVRLATFDMLRARVAAEPVPATPVRSADDGVLSVEHNWTEASGTKAVLTFCQPDQTVQHGYYDAPLVLERIGVPCDLSLKIRWDIRRETVRGQRGEGAELRWPAEWPQPQPATLHVPVFGWQHVERDRYQFPFRARFPVRVPQSDTPKLEVTAALFDAKSDGRIGEPRTLRWESTSRHAIPVTVSWRDETAPDYVREHPIGPQRDAGSILARLQTGSSVGVIAPRRFGKSTLVEYLLAEGAEKRLFMPPAIVCTAFAGSGGFDYQRMWAWVHDRLHEKLGTGLPREWTGALPDEAAFDQVRRAARSQGYKAIVLLFDEAQLFFGQRQGTDIGSRLKNLLERHWSGTGDPSKAPLLLGMIGLPPLAHRAGADLMGILHPIERLEMDEQELRPLIAKIAPRLQTTRGARTRLAASAGNLLVLRAMLESLARRVTTETRTWVNTDDVVAVEEQLKRELQTGRQEHVASFIRDVLNGADRVEDWQPVSSYPVAVALAHVRTKGRPFTEAVDRVVEILNQWCQANQEQDGIRAVYTADIVRRHFAQLEERRVTEGSEFVSGLLESWLMGVARRGAFDQAFRDALFRGAQRQVVIPPGAEPVATGGEASIWRVGELAYRVRLLSSEAERARFEENAEVLSILKTIADRREPGSQYIFDLRDMGLAARNAREAVQVYRWVEGDDLARAQGQFGGDYVIDVGVKLATAVRLLHRNNILHRDICPRNVVLDRNAGADPDEIRPVLIDFGFARLSTAVTATAMAGEHFAPEVRGPRANWTRAADVYSLGWTLAWLLDTAGREFGDLRALLDGCQADAVEARPPAEALLDSLQELETNRSLDDRREQAWTTVWRTARADHHLPWFGPILRRAKPLFVGLQLGLYQSGSERFSAIADLLNQIAEASPKVRGGPKTLRRTVEPGRLDPISVVLALRNSRVHAGTMETEENRVLREAFARLDLPEQAQLVLDAAAVIEAKCELRSLSTVLQPFLVVAASPQITVTR